MISPNIETERLHLYVSKPELARQVLDYNMRNRAFLQPYEATHDEAYFTLARQQELIQQDQEALSRGQGLRVWIAKKSDPHRLIGTVSLSNIVYGAFLSCFLGYKLDGEELRRGYMSEAVGRMVQIAFDEFGLHRVEANIMPWNKASLGVVKKLGFENEGISKQYLKINGVWEDHIHMVILNPEV